ncbi:bifunctional acetate--CoA ligase family protein/GNAT family N-acetyltransferase [Vibrio viridaestus]|uniref:CoA-binding protein n=1 Tax=Vibrio viridaestus TaxID=2487322 RepID=A0A3N9U8F2_9VIBR|nr:bifunctional acetate--CoA ligase family protein/GNAT family N-acetyltransferase [Vibrio viridaestus]RQW64476.1 CoA-binding protein [Vibrio viridaestus]
MNSALSGLFSPQSIAVVGASNRPNRAGKIVMSNLLASGFDGPIMPINPFYSSVCGVLTYPDIASLPVIPDIVILCTHAKRNISIFEQLALKNVKFVIVLSSDMYSADAKGNQIQKQCEDIASSANMRVLGPNSLGIILPWIGLNASFSPVTALKGNIAFISQSAAVCTTILDWANDKGIGFSAFISLGNASDIDFPQLLDSLSVDRHTDSILLYVDSVRDARLFLSAARAASRNKRILVVKGGKTEEGRQAARAHTGGIDTLDNIYDTAIRRSGMLRVNNTHELFAAVETLTHSVALKGESLTIITNGGGPAIMAIDELLSRGGKLAPLSDVVINELNSLLPESWSQHNPIDLVGDASQQRYIDAVNVVMNSSDTHAVLVMHSPSAIAESEETARAVANAYHNHPNKKRVTMLTNWSGELTARKARQVFNQCGIPTYRTPESAVTAFMHIVEYRRNQKQLMETPTNSKTISEQNLINAHQWLAEKSLLETHVNLDTHQIVKFLGYFGFDVLTTWVAQDAVEAIHIAETIGYPVAVKLRSPDIAHKSDVQGVMLGLSSRSEVESAAISILDRTQMHYPDAIIEGLNVQAMAKSAGGEELRIKIKHDETFGPVILIGQGGAEWVESDAEAALPPLNDALAKYTIVRAIKHGRIKLQRLPQPIDIPALCEFLVKLSKLIVECPEVHELDIHPLLINGREMTIIDADLTLNPLGKRYNNRLAIKPYPTELVKQLQLKNGDSVTIRPILPEDEPVHADFIAHVSKEDLYKRFFSEVGEFNHEALANLTQIDFDREMAFVALRSDHIIGVSRALISPDNSNAEFAILIRTDLKGLGLGALLMEQIIDYCKRKKTEKMSGITMPTNQGMISLAKKFGFNVAVDFEEGVAEMYKKLQE